MQRFEGSLLTLILKQLREHGAADPTAEKLTNLAAGFTKDKPEDIAAEVKEILDIGALYGFLGKRDQYYYPIEAEEQIKMYTTEQQHDDNGTLKIIEMDDLKAEPQKGHRRVRKIPASVRNRCMPCLMRNEKNRDKICNPAPEQMPEQKPSKDQEGKNKVAVAQQAKKPNKSSPTSKKADSASEKSDDDDDEEFFSFDSDMVREMKRLLREARPKRRGGRSRSRSRRGGSRRGGSRRRRTRRRR